ncbi:MAG TPA: divergent polysaccharide deacetylase family protein [Nevskiaceae bacterium]|nr:divergent polysaccharide deacetylase family protein [Nevskiaceae bacterium]
MPSGFSSRRWARACAVACCAWSAATLAAPAVSIVIDDLGDRRVEGMEVVALPGPLGCAVLPATPYGAALARAAHGTEKEVLLHFPLQPISGKAHPLAITEHSSRGELQTQLRDDLAALPYVVGVNTHQGSLLSQKVPPMHWLMSEIKAHGGLYFIDSYTTPNSAALRAAQDWGLPTTRREVFLDDVRTDAEITAQFNRLLALARRDGTSLAIGHPYPETIAVLRRELPRLSAAGVALVAPSELIRLRGSPRPHEHDPILLKLTPAMAAAAPTPESAPPGTP